MVKRLESRISANAGGRAGFLCIADGHAVFPDGEVLVILGIPFGYGERYFIRI